LTLLAALLAGGIALAFVRETWAWRLEQVGLLLFAAWGFAFRRVRLPALAAIPVAIIVWGGAQWMLGKTGYPWATENSILMWLSWLAALVLAAAWWDDGMLDWIAGFGSAVAFVALLQRFTSTNGKVYWLFDSGFSTGLMGPLVYENQYAAFIELTLPVVLVLAFATGRVSVAWASAAAMMIVSVVASGSRAGFGLVVLETIVVLALLRAGRKAGALAALVALFAAITGWQLLADKLMRERPYEDRWLLTQSTARMIEDRPLFGFGLGTWSREHPAYATFDDGLFDNHAHNDWAEWAAEGGLPLAALMLLFGVAITPAAYRTVWAIGLLSVLLHCWVDYHFHERPAFGAFYFAMAGAAWRSARLRVL
jgi:hypothetical protein